MTMSKRGVFGKKIKSERMKQAVSQKNDIPKRQIGSNLHKTGTGNPGNLGNYRGILQECRQTSENERKLLKLIKIDLFRPKMT